MNPGAGAGAHKFSNLVTSLLPTVFPGAMTSLSFLQRTAVLGCFALLASANPLLAATTDPAIEAICSDLQKKGLLNGVVLVADGDTIVHHQAYGFASVEHRLPHTLDSRFMIASATKPLTATAILQAVEQGKLDLKKPIGSYLDEIQGTPAGELTIHELLSQSGGVPAFAKDQTEPYTREAFVAGLKTAKLNSDGKGKFAYQNENFMILALLLEKLQGSSYAAILQRQIFDPLAMKDSGVNLGGKVVDRLAAGYVNQEGATLYPPVNNLSQTFGAGCVYATATDLLKFLRAVGKREILKPESIDLMREPKSGPYSYGWFTRQVNGKRLIAAFGRMPGYSSLMATNDDGVSFIVLNNIYDCPVMPLLQRLVAARTAPAPAKP